LHCGEQRYKQEEEEEEFNGQALRAPAERKTQWEKTSLKDKSPSKDVRIYPKKGTGVPGENPPCKPYGAQNMHKKMYEYINHTC
jgi:hypothetical protein